MHKIYSNSDNHHVKATLVYANEGKKLYFDPEFTKPVSHKKGELYDLFVNGMIIAFGDYLYRPTVLNVDGGAVACGDVAFVVDGTIPS